ncbi:DNA circularization N-terminal domain-containing protein [Rhizosaccharibacter radicis]|uniref:DNA circularization N-terminal domain-containing protein n=1 Tax=Rhizosaccharibacter radicis TaxID=2782605 RepID=A0ABT1VW04_9PROT|nr:DNA circularization N-terminal domain-containing protein [Acetobacteraceae bacterium KSS12]
MSGTLGGNILSVLDQYRQGSFRGVPFAVIGSGGTAGRKIALHDYPFRDDPWPEDLGRRGRGFRVRGFLCGQLFRTQFDLLLLAVERKGPGLLIHPTRGLVQASVLNFEWREPDGFAGVIEFELELIEVKSLLGTSIVVAAHAVIAVACAALGSSASADHASDAAAAFAYGAPVIRGARSVAVGWAGAAAAACRSPRVTGAALATLPTYYGRFVSGNAPAGDPAGTVAAALAGVTVGQAAVDAAVAAVQEALDGPALAVAILAVPEALRAAVADPGVQLALLFGMTEASAPGVAGGAPIGAAIGTAQVATAALCRRSAVVSIAAACSDYQPTSYDDAQALRTRAAALFDAEILAAGDASDDATFGALRSLKAQVLADLANRATQIGRLVAVSRNMPLPAPVLAQQLYADGSRAPDLVTRADPVHPAFMPTSFEALNA